MKENKKAISILEHMKNLITVRIFEEEALEMAIQALEEIQQYRAIGTIEEFKALKEKGVAKSRIIKDGKYYCCSCNRFAKTSGHCSYCGQSLY